MGVRVTRKSAAERRTDLIEAGLRVIAREGMHGATVRAIVAEAGVPLATFHYVFRSRDEMIGEAYAYVVLPDPDAQDPHVPAEETLPEVIRALMQDWVDRLDARPEFELAIMEIMAYCRRSPALEHLPGEVQQRYVEAVSGLIEAACERTGVEPGLPEVRPQFGGHVLAHATGQQGGGLTQGLTHLGRDAHTFPLHHKLLSASSKLR